MSGEGITIDSSGQSVLPRDFCRVCHESHGEESGLTLWAVGVLHRLHFHKVLCSLVFLLYLSCFKERPQFSAFHPSRRAGDALDLEALCVTLRADVYQDEALRETCWSNPGTISDDQDLSKLVRSEFPLVGVCHVACLATCPTSTQHMPGALLVMTIRNV